MTILLDSHTFFWYLTDDARLSKRAVDVIRSSPEVYVSAVVAWEIASKVRSGKWSEAATLSARFFELIDYHRFQQMPLSLQHAHLAGTLPGAHRDPFDRMLAAQSLIEGMPLVTADPAFRTFGTRVLW